MTDRQKLMGWAYTTLGMTVPFLRDAPRRHAAGARMKKPPAAKAGAA